MAHARHRRNSLVNSVGWLVTNLLHWLPHQTERSGGRGPRHPRQEWLRAFSSSKSMVWPAYWRSLTLAGSTEPDHAG